MTLDTKGYIGEYILFNFTLGAKVSGTAFEIEKNDLQKQLGYTYLSGIKDMPFTKNIYTKRIEVTVRNEDDSLKREPYRTFKTALDYCLTSELTTPQIQMKFTVVRNPASVAETIEEFQ